MFASIASFSDRGAVGNKQSHPSCTKWLAVALFAVSPMTGAALADCTPATPCVSGMTIFTPPAPYQSSTANSVSFDGSVVTGNISGGGVHTNAYRWTNGTITALGTLPGGVSSFAVGVSADGTTIVGYADASGGDTRAFRWAGGQMTDLGALAGGTYSAATGVSVNGSIIVGYSNTTSWEPRAWRWANGILQDLGTLPGGTAAQAFGVSADGSVVAGWSDGAGFLLNPNFSTPASHAFRWVGGVMTDLGTLPGRSTSEALAVSADGLVVVGDSGGPGTQTDAFRWSGGVMTDIAPQNSNGNSWATGVSGNGAVVVGYYFSSGSQMAFRWTAATGSKNLNSLLATAGVNMTGITLQTASGVSGNGQFIVGNGIFNGPLGGTQGYIVRYVDWSTSSGPIAGLTNLNSIQSSVNSLSNTIQSAGANEHGFAAPLLGNGRPIIDDASFVGAYGSAGSAAAGAYGRYAFGGGFQLLGGLAYAQEDYDNATLEHALIGAIALRYVQPNLASWKPFIEGGTWYAPGAGLTLDRTYANGAGTARGTGRTNADMSYLFGRAGIAWNTDGKSQMAIVGEYGHERAALDGYAEQGNGNPFNAVVSGGTEEMNLAKIGFQYSTLFTQTVDATIYVNGGKSFNPTTNLSATVAGIGTFPAAAPTSTRWAEFGARIETKLTSSLTLDVFADGIAGPDSTGTNIHTGAGLRLQF